MKRNLDLTVTRHGRTEDRLDLHADPDDVATLRATLVNWLEGHKWHPGRYREFELLVRFEGEGKVRRKVRA